MSFESQKMVAETFQHVEYGTNEANSLASHTQQLDEEYTGTIKSTNKKTLEVDKGCMEYG